MNWKKGILILSALTVFASCGPVAPTPVQQNRPETSVKIEPFPSTNKIPVNNLVLVFIAGNNNLSQYAVYDSIEIEKGERMTHTAYIGLGSNLGKRAVHIKEAICGLEKLGKIRRISRAYRTVPWGLREQPRFINMALCLETELSAKELLEKCLKIEASIGRVRVEHWGPRVIDIDLLFYDKLVQNTTVLILPHPRIEERLFVLDPMCDIAADFRHPVSGLTISEIRSRLISSS